MPLRPLTDPSQWWLNRIDELDVADPIDASGIERFSGWPKRVDSEIGWNEPERRLDIGAKIAFYGNAPCVHPCYTADYNRDHLVPWEGALRSGLANGGRAEQREFYYWTPNIFVLNARVNDEKSDHGPERWKPLHEQVWARYAATWANIKRHWRLTVTEAEKAALEAMIAT